MKVLYISTPSFSDCDFPLIKAFQEKKLDVTYLILLAPYSLHSTLFDIKKQINKTGIFNATSYLELKKYEQYFNMNKVYVANRISSKSYSWSFWKLNYDIYKFIKNGDFNLIHSDVLLGKIYGYMYRLTNLWIQTVHDPFPHTGDVTKRNIERYNYAIKRANKFVLLNNIQLDKFCKYYCIRKEDVLINRLGIYENIRSFVKPEEKEIDNSILFFGRISPYKGIDYLCEAMVKIHEKVPNATLTIAGSGDFYFDISKYQKLSYFQIINNYISTEELASLINRASICVCPYTDATQSGVIMTCYSLFKPVIATNVGGLCEMVDNGKTGLLIQPKNVKAIEEAILTLINNQDLRSRMIENIKSIYEHGNGSWNEIAIKYINFYHKVLGF